MSFRQFCRRLDLAALSGLLIVAAGCPSSTPNEPIAEAPAEVIVYAALDTEFSQPILDDFSRETGIAVKPKFDTEATKTVGLANAIIAEAKRPRCDVFWNNEILNTLRLKEQGLLETYQSPAAASFPEAFRAADGAWHGFAGRARVLLVNNDVVPAEQRPRSINDLADPKWRGKTGIAKPLFGTTATHAACLFAVWGEDKAKEFFQKLKANEVQIMAGNKQVAQGVSSGRLAFGITDTDDAIIEVEQGRPVTIVYPDREPDELGTLFIPNTLAIIRGCPHPEAARKLVDYLLQPKVEARLAEGASAQIPLNAQVDVKLRVETPKTVKAMPVDFAAAVKQWDVAAKFLQAEFTGAE
ncbi:MAG: extracellular solute-binding protein [Planctomycetes bacterium]|nr:extracellular solute-binding protein [Planctomycetota bacterium]